MQAEKLVRETGFGAVVSRSPDGLAQRLAGALVDNTRSDIGQGRFGLDGKLNHWSDTLVGALDPAWLDDLGTLADRSKFREPHSGQAIALNSFLHWQRNPERLSIAGQTGFRELRFGGRCPTGIRGTPPYLDLIAANGSQIVAVTARALEYLGRRRSKLAQTYLDIPSSKSLAAWREIAVQVHDDPNTFRHVDAAALVKFAYGLGRTFPSHRIKLNYLFWEPTAADGMAAFAAHRAELAQISDRVADSSVSVSFGSFHDLWDTWWVKDDPDWVRELVAQLRERFTVVLAP